MAFKHLLHFTNLILFFCFLVKNVAGGPSEESILQEQVRLTIDLCDQLHEIHNFDNIIVYRTPDRLYEPPIENGLLLKARNNHEEEETWNDIVHKSVGNVLADHIFSLRIHKPLMIFTISPWAYINDTKSIPNLGNVLTNKNLAIVILNDIFNVELKEFVALSLGASLETKIVFLLIGHELTGVFPFIRLEKLRRFFRWSWSKNILNVILLFQKDKVKSNLDELKLEVYTHSPFPEPTAIIQLTGQHPRDYFQERTKDLKGYRFRTPVYHDIPSVFWSIDRKNGQKTVSGIAGHIYREFVKKINATFVDMPIDDVNPYVMDHLYALLAARNIDMAIHPFTALLPNDFFTSYPISNTNSCVVVPVMPEIFVGLYIPLTFNLNMWLVLLIMFMLFQVTFILINYQTYKQWRPWEAFATTLQGILSMPVNLKCLNTALTSRVSLRRKLFVYLFLTTTGILYCQMHIAALSSFLSSTLYPKQLETLEDIRAANISIMLLKYKVQTLNYLDLISLNFTDNLKIADAQTISNHVNSLNTSYAYVVYNEEWKVMQRLQMELWKPRFRIVPQLCIPNVYLTFPMQFNSPFYHPLKEFIMQTQSTGLEAKWSDTVFLDIQHASSGANGSQLTDYEHPVPLNLAHLTYVLYVYVMGVTLALLVFLGELWWGKKVENRF